MKDNEVYNEDLIEKVLRAVSEATARKDYWMELVDSIESIRFEFPLGDKRRDYVLSVAARVASEFKRLNDKSG